MTILLPVLFALQAAAAPTAEPPPQDDATATAIMRPINAILAAIAEGDGGRILAQVRPDGSATVASEAADGRRSIKRMGWADFAAKVQPGPRTFDERLTDTAIDYDGDIAMVWAPYVVLINAKPHHCGVNHFDLVREAGAWKVQNVTWSSRTTGCVP